MECKECYNELSKQTFPSSFGDMQISQATSFFISMFIQQTKLQPHTSERILILHIIYPIVVVFSFNENMEMSSTRLIALYVDYQYSSEIYRTIFD